MTTVMAMTKVMKAITSAAIRYTEIRLQPCCEQIKVDKKRSLGCVFLRLSIGDAGYCDGVGAAAALLLLASTNKAELLPSTANFDHPDATPMLPRLRRQSMPALDSLFRFSPCTSKTLPRNSPASVVMRWRVSEKPSRCPRSRKGRWLGCASGLPSVN